MDLRLGKGSLERVRLAAKVAKQKGLPIFTAGRLPDARGGSQSIDQSEATIMTLTRQIWHESLGAVWYAIRY